MAYKYKPRSADQVARRQAQSNNDFVSIFKDGIKQYKVKEDAKNSMRIMPPTWPNAEHYGLDVWVHYSVGPDNVSVLCLQKHLGKRCPICELRTKLQSAGDEEEAKALRPGKAVAMYVIDRDNESEGVMAWRAPFSVDQDILSLCVDENGEMMNIDDPKEGYDIFFATAGKGIQRKYKSVRTAKRPSSVSSKFMAFVEETPLPDALNFLSTKAIEAILGGTPKKKSRDDDDDDDDDRTPTKRRASRDDDEDEDDRPMKKSRGRRDDDEDDDDEPAPKKKSRARDDDDDDGDERPKTKRRSARDDDDEDDEDDRPKKKAKRVVDEDDDEDDEPAPKKKRKPADDDDEDEDPPFDKGKKVKRKDEDDEDEDEDDEDEKPKSQVRQRLAERKRR